ncbi:MAG: Clp protease N-terminal domain-containing protein [Chloroflexota bacterium]|nr:Clp protease N-terminal domain-containing protein [Chloroflexota bacterium]
MFRDIEISARQESARMRHHYLGVEHYFIGLLDLSDGLLGRLLDLHGVTPDYVRDTLRRYMGRGARKRQRFVGNPSTPRAALMLNLAYEIARDAKRDEPNERDILLAILEEGDSIPIRILRRLNIAIDELARQANADSSGSFPRPSILKLDFSPAFDSSSGLNEEHVFILRRMFNTYATLRIERQLTGGYSGALVLLVTPIQADGAEDASVVVKIADAASILDEERRYNQYVRNTLPPLTARLEDKTTAEIFDVAGLKYTFVPDHSGGATSMRVLAREMGAAQLGTWLKEQLFPYFGKNWWMQRRSYRFQVWEEYDWLLPPLLTLDYVSDEEAKAAKSLSLVVDKQIQRGRAEGIEYGALVGVHHFVVQRIYREKRMIQLSLGLNTSETIYRAYPILIRNVDIAAGGYFHTEMIERQYGRIWKTRRDSFFEALSQLAADFDPRGSDIPITNTIALPNPILTYDNLLDRQVDGTLSRIHGDLHLGNILRGAADIRF